MRGFYIAVLMAGLCFWSEVATGQEGSWSGEAEVVGHERLDQVGRFIEVQFNVSGFVTGDVTHFRGWMSNNVWDRGRQVVNTQGSSVAVTAKDHCCLKRACSGTTGLSNINAGIYFHSDGTDGQFPQERLIPLSYLRKNQRSGEELIVISRPRGFDLTPTSHGYGIDAQAALVAYLDCAFGLGSGVEIYGHGIEPIGVALRVNQEYPSTASRVTGFPRTVVQRRENDRYYHLLFKRFENMVAASGGSDLEINLWYNPYDELGEKEIDSFYHRFNGLLHAFGATGSIALHSGTGFKNRVISDGSIDSRDLELIEDQLLQNQAYAREHLGLTTSGVNVYIGNDPSWLTARYIEAYELNQSEWDSYLRKRFNPNNNPHVEAGFPAIMIPAYNQHWRSTTHENRGNIVTHEWWHANVQYHFLNSFCCTDGNRMQHTGPAWLSEGSAQIWSMSKAGGIEEDIAWRRGKLRTSLPAGFNLMDLNTRRGWRKAGDEYKYDAREVASYMLRTAAGFESFVDFYGNLGSYYADEAARAGINSTVNVNQTMKFSREFFDLPRRVRKLNEIFDNAFGWTMEQFAEEFRRHIQQQ